MKLDKNRGLLEKRRTVPERVFFAGFNVVLFIWSLLMLGMLFWALMSSLKTNLEYLNKPLMFPKEFHFENFELAISKLYHNGVGFFGMLYNSMWLSLGSAILSTFTCCVTGYIFAQYKFKGRDFLFSLVVFVMIIPIYGALPAQYKLIYDLGLNDSYLFLIQSLSGFGGNMLLTYGYFKTSPKELREAVFMDGGSDYVAFFKIYFPLAKNIFVALFLLGFIGTWNDYQTSMLYFDKRPNLALGLYNFQQEIRFMANDPAYFAGTIIVMIPVIILFVSFSDKIMGQLYSGGLKG